MKNGCLVSTSKTAWWTMDHLTSIENPYAAPTADEAAIDEAQSPPAPRLAVRTYLAGLGLCGAGFAADRLLPVKLASEAFPVVFCLGICLSSAGVVGMKRRWFVSLGLVFLIFVVVIVEVLVVGAMEMMLKGIGRFG